MSEPRTEAWDALLDELPGGPGQSRANVTAVIARHRPRIEAEAIASRDAEIRAGVMDARMSDLIVGQPNGTFIRRDAVLALLSPAAEPPESGGVVSVPPTHETPPT